MDIKRYLALTASEFAASDTLPEPPAWMACHFSSYGTGLSNIPDTLPSGSMIIVNDRTPPHGHDQNKIAQQLNLLASKFNIQYFLLDFQQENNQETASLVAELPDKIDGTVAVTEAYANYSNCPVFLTCPLPHQRLTDSIKQWHGRELWLELGAESEIITITDKEARIEFLQENILSEKDRIDASLHSRYRTEIFEGHARITLERSPRELLALLEEASAHGIKIAVGLYQQFM